MQILLAPSRCTATVNTWISSQLPSSSSDIQDNVLTGCFSPDIESGCSVAFSQEGLKNRQNWSEILSEHFSSLCSPLLLKSYFSFLGLNAKWIRMPIVTVQLGQCGNQIGHEVFNTICSDVRDTHGLCSKKENESYCDACKERFFCEEQSEGTAFKCLFPTQGLFSSLTA